MSQIPGHHPPFGGYSAPPGFPPPMALPPPAIAVAAHDGKVVPATSWVERIPGTTLGVAYPRVPPTVSGPAIGGLVAGIASILTALVVGCFGAATPVGVGVGGAFAVLGLATGGGGVGLGLFGMRQVRRGAGRVAGRGIGISGLACGGVGIVLTMLAFLLALVVAANAPDVEV